VEIQSHGALVDVLDVGVLIVGPSGIGKSECALELVGRGHRLVADDVVKIRVHEGSPVGTAPELIRHHMEIRGIGLLYIPEIFGPDSVRLETSIDLVCHFEEWREGSEYERLGLDRPTEDVAGLPVPSLVLPVRPARNMATLVEVAARDALQRRSGVNAAKRLDSRLRVAARERRA
jgi:HPr kinase/phosphorylase